MVQILAEYGGFAVEYDQTKNPYFKSIMLENLTLLQSKDLGRKLLKLIKDATPQSRGSFPLGVNVVCRPFQMQYIQSGQKLAYSAGSAVRDTLAASAHPKHNVQGCRFHKYGSSLNKAVDPAQNDKNGTVCYMDFANTQVMESDGTPTWAHIVLAHELIHSYHCLYGMHAGAEEEKKTTGIDGYEAEEFTEQAFRAVFDLPARKGYG